MAGMLVPAKNRAAGLPPAEAYRELRRRQEEEAGRMAEMPDLPNPELPPYIAERRAERASLEEFQKTSARIDEMLEEFERYEEKIGALADSQFVERNARQLAEVEDAIRKNNPGLVQEKLNILARRVRNWASKRRKPEAVSEPGGKVPPPDMRANALRGRAEEREREAKPNDLPEVSTNGADNIYLRMPLERVRRDAAHGVKLAQEALKELEAPEIAVPATRRDVSAELDGGAAPGKLKEYQSMPEGWRVVEGATTAPRGFVVISNGKGRFAPGRESGLLREDRVPVSEKPEPAPEIARLAGVGSTAEIVERLENGERLTVETKVKTDAGSAENISIYASRRPDGRFSIVTGRGNGADNLTAAQLRKKLDRMKFENPAESSARFEPAEKAEYSLSRKPVSIQDFREMPAHPRPERAKFDNLRELYDIYKREYLGKTFTAASGHTMTFKPGHFFRLIAGTPQDGQKAWLPKRRTPPKRSE